MNAFTQALYSFGMIHPVLAGLILFFGFPEVEVIILVILGILALAGR